MREPARNATLLLYAPVPLHGPKGALTLEAQACNGLRLWAENFDAVIVMLPWSAAPAPAGWLPLAAVGPNLARIEIVALPMAYRPDQFLRHYPATQAQIAGLIGRAGYLSFAIGGLFGDWGAVAALTAHRLHRPFAVWTDRVESEVVRRGASDGPWRARLRARLTHRPMAWLERAVIGRAALGLFHGRETFDAYAPICGGVAALVHDIHIAASDHMVAGAVEAKARQAAGGPLRIVYAGRADAMKGPMDWIAVLEGLAAAGVAFEAVWFGDGPERGAMQAHLAGAGLTGRVRLPGFIADRAQVLGELRAAQVFLFCHKTPESPRNLIEALVSACPIVGYDGAYAQDLIAAHGGGRLTPAGDVAALTQCLTELDRDRSLLADLIGRAASDGAPFDDVTVFRHRADLIKAHLAQPR